MAEDDPNRDPRDAKIERMEAELRKSAKTLFTDAPDPGPIPEVLRKSQYTPPSTATVRRGDQNDSKAIIMKVSAIGTNFVLSVAAAGLLGWLLDYWLKTKPWCILGGLIVGLVFGFFRFIRDATAAGKQAGKGRRGS